MIYGVLLKTLRETRGLALAGAVAVFFTTALLARILPQMQSGITQFAQHAPGLRDVLSGLLGLSVVNVSTPMLLALIWAHPVVIALVFGFEVCCCTRFPAGEVERGTIDVLLGWPVSRRSIYACETVVALGWGVAILGLAWLGFLLSTSFLPLTYRPSGLNIGLVVANLFLVYLAVAGVTLLISTLSSQQGRAMAVVFALLTGSYLLNFLALFWPPAEDLAWLSLLHYYQPGAVLLRGSIPTLHIEVLAGVAVGCWLAGALVISRRNLCTT